MTVFSIALKLALQLHSRKNYRFKRRGRLQ